MRFRRLITGLAVAVCAAVPVASKAAPATDWVVATMPVQLGAGSHHTDPTEAREFAVGPVGHSGPPPGPSLQISGIARVTGPSVMGAVFSVDGESFALVFDDQDGGTRIRTTDDFGGLDVEVGPAGHGTIFFSMGIHASEKAKRLSLLAFVPRAQIDRVAADDSDGPIPTMTSGSGSRAIYAAGPDTSGVAVDASYAAAGMSTDSIDESKGIVGGAVYGCTRCTLNWKSPDGRSGSVTQTNPPPVFLPLPFPPPPLPLSPLYRLFGEGDPTFVGPPGQWSLSWTGVNAPLGFAFLPPGLIVPAPQPSPTIAAAYAPVGEAWKYFTRAPTVIPAPTGPGAKGATHRSRPRVLGTKTTRLANTGVSSMPIGWILLTLAVAAAGIRRTARPA